MRNNRKIAFEESSGNVCADIRLDDAEELFRRAKLSHSARMILEKKKRSQQEIRKLLDIKQLEVLMELTRLYRPMTSRPLESLKDEFES